MLAPRPPAPVRPSSATPLLQQHRISAWGSVVPEVATEAPAGPASASLPKSMLASTRQHAIVDWWKYAPADQTGGDAHPSHNGVLPRRPTVEQVRPADCSFWLRTSDLVLRRYIWSPCSRRRVSLAWYKSELNPKPSSWCVRYGLLPFYLFYITRGPHARFNPQSA